MFGIGDLPEMDHDRRLELFVNKMTLHSQPLLFECLEEYMWNRTRKWLLGQSHFSTEPYLKYDLVWNHNPS